MTRLFTQRLLKPLAAAVVAIALGLASEAQATFSVNITYNAGVVPFTPAPVPGPGGNLAFAGTGFTFDSSSAQFGSTSSIQSNFRFTSLAPSGTYVFTIMEDNFGVPPGIVGLLTSQLTSVTAQVPGNPVGGVLLESIVLSGGQNSAVGNPLTTSTTVTPIALPLARPYTLVSRVTVTVAGSQTANFGSTSGVGPSNIPGLPVPATILAAAFGAPLLGAFGMMRRRFLGA